MKSLAQAMLGLVAATALAPSARAAEEVDVVGVVAAHTRLVPREGALILVAMAPRGERDSRVCDLLLARYGSSAAYDPTSGAYPLYWLAPGQVRALTSANCSGRPPERAGVPNDVYDYRVAARLMRRLRLDADAGPYLVVARCEADGVTLVNAGFIDLGQGADDELQGKLAALERYLEAPANWGKKRRIDRDLPLAAKDLLQFPARFVGRNLGFIKRMRACRVEPA